MLSKRDATIGMLALLASSPQIVNALDPDICASVNTANMEKFTDNLQSNGLCYDHCFGEYAFSITKGYDCWCSNYAPAESIQLSASDCDFPCWGYPEEPCGGDGAWGYVRLRNVQPSGTRGGGSSEPTRSSSDPEETQDSESTTEPASTAVRTVTADGTIKTVFVGPTNSPDDNNNNGNVDSDSDRADGEVVENGGGGGGGLSRGALAGIIVGVALAVIAVVGVGLWFFFRRRKSQQQQEDYQEDPSIRGSSAGMMGGGHRQEMSMGGGSPGSPNTSSNRNSALMIDPRMDPFKQGLYVRSGSHESINTLRDDHDYSRKIQQRTLRATNPDPDTVG